MKITLIGYGKMGKTIEKIAIERGHTIVGVIDNDADTNWDTITDADVAIEFSTPASVIANIKKCFSHHTPIVVGTTGWENSRKAIVEECLIQNQALLYAANFSIGVNLFFELNKHLGQLMNNREEYTPFLKEIHHTEKLDAPSGTAIHMANDLIENTQKYNTWKLVETPSTQTKPNEIPIQALRESGVPGTHTLSFESDIDLISISHQAKNRKGFALGAVIAAEWLKSKKGVFQMKDVLNIK